MASKDTAKKMTDDYYLAQIKKGKDKYSRMLFSEEQENGEEVDSVYDDLDEEI